MINTDLTADESNNLHSNYRREMLTERLKGWTDITRGKKWKESLSRKRKGVLGEHMETTNINTKDNEQQVSSSPPLKKNRAIIISGSEDGASIPALYTSTTATTTSRGGVSVPSTSTNELESFQQQQLQKRTQPGGFSISSDGQPYIQPPQQRRALPVRVEVRPLVKNRHRRVMQLDGKKASFVASTAIETTTAIASGAQGNEIDLSTSIIIKQILPDRVKDRYEDLSDEQKHVHDLVMKSGKNVFFTGSAGTGKSILLRAIIKSMYARYPKNANRVAVTAPTGIAATNINGVTIHSFAHIKLGDEPVSYYIERFAQRKSLLKSWEDVRVLIIDEISMIDADLLDKLEEIARITRKTNAPFGGIQLVLAGDFYQLPPVSKFKKIKMAFEAKCWTRIAQEIVFLKSIYRQSDHKFRDMLNELRVGKVTDETVCTLEYLSRIPELPEGVSPTELYSLRSDVSAANSSRLQQLEEEEHKFQSSDYGNRDILKNCMAPELLNLKVGAQVMLIKNLIQNSSRQSTSLVNGSIGVIKRFAPYGDLNFKEVPVVMFSNGTELPMEPQDWDYDLKAPGQSARRRQIPLILAWAMSIHKSQGQTIEFVKIDLKNVFEAGQAYVALSRATKLENLQVLNFEKSRIKTHEKAAAFYKDLK